MNYFKVSCIEELRILNEKVEASEPTWTLVLSTNETRILGLSDRGTNEDDYLNYVK